MSTKTGSKLIPIAIGVTALAVVGYVWPFNDMPETEESRNKPTAYFSGTWKGRTDATAVYGVVGQQNIEHVYDVKEFGELIPVKNGDELKFKITTHKPVEDMQCSILVKEKYTHSGTVSKVNTVSISGTVCEVKGVIVK